jgi:hypothetical protein
MAAELFDDLMRAKERQEGAFELETLRTDQLTQKLTLVRDALNTVKDTLHYVMVQAPGYDWNADPFSVTLRTGKAFAKAEAALRQTAHEELRATFGRDVTWCRCLGEDCPIHGGPNPEGHYGQ